MDWLLRNLTKNEINEMNEIKMKLSVTKLKA